MPDEFDEWQPSPALSTRSVLEWAGSKGVPDWLLRAAAARAKWSIRPETDPSETTEDAFDEAIRMTRDDRV